MSFLGARSNAKPVGEDLQPGKSHYLIGSDPKQWRTDVPNFARVRYGNLYPGIDLVYYGNQRQLEYDLVVSPGAKPETVVLDFEGLDDSSEPNGMPGLGIDPGGVPSAGLTWYFAEGDTSNLTTSGAVATTLLVLLNPGTSTASLTINYMLENGTVISRNHTLPGQRLLSLDAAAEIGSGLRFSMEVLSDNPIVAERLMFSGTDVGDSVGSPATGYVWNLAEGFTAFGYETWAIISNPGSESASVTARYLKQNGQNLIANYVLPAKQRLTVYLNTSVDEATSVSSQFTSDKPIVVERTMKFASRAGIHQSMGVRQ